MGSSLIVFRHYQVFCKGCPLVPDLSRAIVKLREDGKLNTMKNSRSKSPSNSTSSSDDSSN